MPFDPSRRPAPKNVRRAAVPILLIVAAIIVLIFVGLNLSHYKSLKDEQAISNGG